jgi:hypothetical protein
MDGKGGQGGHQTSLSSRGMEGLQGLALDVGFDLNFTYTLHGSQHGKREGIGLDFGLHCMAWHGMHGYEFGLGF